MVLLNIILSRCRLSDCFVWSSGVIKVSGRPEVFYRRSRLAG